ncbi:MAG: shikimate kinase [Gammaproteobacteria bacterium]|nr:shikimate kinase [Gammaproteobacteria bacterium]
MNDPADGGSAPPPPSRILLIGFMASGKSAVGREVARLLGWRFVDFDEEIRRETGQEIADIFDRGGEGEFRAIEARVARRLLRRDRTVLASGGGWAAQPGHMEGVAADTLSVWLKVTAETAVERARRQGVDRPLLDVPRPVEHSRRLLARREPYYRLARLTLDSEDVSVAALADRIARLARQGIEPASSPPPAHPS